MKKKKILLLGVGMVLFLIGIAGCGDNPPTNEFSTGNIPYETLLVEHDEIFPPVSDLNDGLNLLEVSPGKELRGAYVKEVDEVRLVTYFQAIHGDEPNALELVWDPDQPEYGVDIRFLATDGWTMTGSFAGHGYVNRDWAPKNNEKAQKMAESDMRIHDRVMMGDIRDSMKQVIFPERLNEEIRRIIHMADIDSDPSEWFLPGFNTSTSRTEQTHGVTRHALVSGTPYTHYTKITKKDAFQRIANRWVVGDHSAVSFRSYRNSNGTLLYRTYSCNHGACADYNSMRYHCQKQFGKHNIFPPFGTNERTCELEGSGYTMHVCNNDTEVQYANIKRGYRYSYNRSCWFQPRRWAPSCN
jgi:hypothetical protein